MSRHACRHAGVKGIQFDDFSAIPALWVDPILMQIAMYNLLQNAIKYSHRDTFVDVASECAIADHGTRYRIHVSNYGIGVAEQDRDRVVFAHTQVWGW